MDAMVGISACSQDLSPRNDFNRRHALRVPDLDAAAAGHFIG